jgi:hypothetical protein
MPALQRIIPSRGKEFWDALDPDNVKQVLEAVKEEVKLNVGLAIQDLISVSLRDQSRHASFTTLIPCRGARRLGTISRVTAIA